MFAEIIQKRYPKTIALKDGMKIDLRPLQKDDKDLVWNFFKSIPDNDRLFLKDDVVQKEVIDSWCNKIYYEEVLPLLAIHEGKVVGDASLHMNQRTWMRHIARVRVVIHPNYRQKGLASLLVKELSEIGKASNLEILDAEFMDAQKSAIDVFEKVGFRKIANLEQHVIDIAGKAHDFIIMAYPLK